jgi:hypothetical protein
MRLKLQIGTVLLAWFIATGAQWDLVQSFAWGRMIAGYSRTMPLAEAVRLTFQPDNLCSICQMVSVAKQQQSKEAGAPGSSAVSKAPLIFQAAPSVVVAPPAVAHWRAVGLTVAGIGRTAPPLPPPRLGVA